MTALLPPTVLVVEDHPLLRGLWRQRARALGVELLATETTAQARAALATMPVALVVCDWNLGRGETSQALVAELLADGVPCVVTSGDRRVLDALSGRVRALLKPCPAEVMDEVLRGAQPRSTAVPGSAPR